MEIRDIKKLYYSISEVSEITDLKQYVLRYWETEFAQLKPKKNTAGNRIYRAHDIDTLLAIKSLLYERKFTIKGAQQHLNQPDKISAKNSDQKKIIKLKTNTDINTLKDLKHGLNDLIMMIEKYKD